MGLLIVSNGVVVFKLDVIGATVGRLVDEDDDDDGRFVVAGLVGNSWTSF